MVVYGKFSDFGGRKRFAQLVEKLYSAVSVFNGFAVELV